MYQTWIGQRKRKQTHLRSNYTEQDDEKQYKSKKPLSEMLNKMEINTDKEDDNNSDNDDDSTSDLKYLVTILQDAIEELQEHDQLEICKKWCTLVKRNSFPLGNMYYLLFLDLVTWFINNFDQKPKHYGRLIKGKSVGKYLIVVL